MECCCTSSHARTHRGSHTQGRRVPWQPQAERRQASLRLRSPRPPRKPTRLQPHRTPHQSSRCQAALHQTPLPHAPGLHGIPCCCWHSFFLETRARAHAAPSAPSASADCFHHSREEECQRAGVHPRRRQACRGRSRGRVKQRLGRWLQRRVPLELRNSCNRRPHRMPAMLPQRPPAGLWQRHLRMPGSNHHPWRRQAALAHQQLMCRPASQLKPTHRHLYLLPAPLRTLLPRPLLLLLLLRRRASRPSKSSRPGTAMKAVCWE